MKWIIIIILIFVIMLIAYAVSEQYKEKYDFYNNFKIFLNQFKLNVSFKQEKIFNVLDKTKSKKQFTLFINAYKTYLKTDELNLKAITILDEDEKSELTTIIKSIGRFDAENEIKQIETFLVDIDNRLNKAEKDKNKLCPMILKLSLLFAIALCILLI